MNRLLAIVVGAALIVLLLVFSTTYSVSFHEVAIKRTFGRTSEASVKTEPGLKFKWPIFQDRTKHDTRLQIKESSQEEISLADGQQVVVKAFLLWKIDTTTPESVLRFDRSFGSIDDADSALTDPFVTTLAGALSAFNFDDLIGRDNRLAAAEERIAADLGPTLQEKGIVPVQVGISQLVLPERTTGSVIRRMEATRAKLAEAQRFRGNAMAERIATAAATDADKIRVFAEQRAEEIRAQGSDRAEQYMDQMSEDEQLAIFLAWLDALDKALAENVTVVLDTDFAPWHLMNVGNEGGAGAIPQPARGLEADEAPAGGSP